MKYLYGDATPFPLEENFIDTLIAATDACVALFECDELVDERRRQARALRERVDEELSRMLVLQRAMEAALKPMLPEGDPAYAAEATAQRIRDSVQTAIEGTRQSLIQRRNSAVNTRAVDKAVSDKMRAALEKFFLEHQLPKTQWKVCWGGGTQPGEAELVLASQTPFDLHAGFKAALPEEHDWSGPISIADLSPGLPLVLQRSTKRLGRSRTSKELVTRYFITGVEVSPTHATFTIKKNPKKSSLGYELTMRGVGQSEPVIHPIGDDGEREDPLSVSGENAVALSQLWNEISKAMKGLVAHRTGLVSVRLRDTELDNAEEPAELGEALLSAIAPIVREMRLRSRVPGELVLKRELGDGKREELFVPRQTLQDKYAKLPYKHRAAFEAAGLGSEATREFVTRAIAPGPDDDEDEEDVKADAPTINQGPPTTPMATAPAA